MVAFFGSASGTRRLRGQDVFQISIFVIGLFHPKTFAAAVCDLCFEIAVVVKPPVQSLELSGLVGRLFSKCAIFIEPLPESVSTAGSDNPFGLDVAIFEKPLPLANLLIIRITAVLFQVAVWVIGERFPIALAAVVNICVTYVPVIVEIRP